MSGTLPKFRTCEDDVSLSVEIKSESSVGSYDWGGDGTETTNGFVYNTDGAYIITNTTGNCAATKMVALGLATTRPCTVTSAHTGSTYNPISGGGGGGLETVNSEGKVVKVQDQDGNSYAVVQIGSQCWMRSNLRTTHFSDGTEIPNGTGMNGSSHTQSYVDPFLYKPVTGAKMASSFSYRDYYEK